MRISDQNQQKNVLLSCYKLTFILETDVVLKHLAVTPILNMSEVLTSYIEYVTTVLTSYVEYVPITTVLTYQSAVILY